ncbi:hypothetical protein RSAG8_06001, partial [Rhizoctonia solani AG-8 WAC10335]
MIGTFLNKTSNGVESLSNSHSTIQCTVDHQSSPFSSFQALQPGKRVNLVGTEKLFV